MEDQGKRLLITVGMVGVLYLVWTTFFVPHPPPQTQAPAPQIQVQPTPAAVAADSGAPAVAVAAPGAAPAAPVVAECDPAKEEKPARWETADFEATFSRCGGALSSFVLRGAQYRVEKDGQPAHQIDLIRTRDNPATFPLQVQVEIPPAGSVSADEKRVPVIPARAEWELVSATDSEVVYRWKAADGVLQVTKRFAQVPASRYAFRMEYEVKNVSTRPGDKRAASSSVALFGFEDPNGPERSFFHYAEPKWGTGCYVDGSLKTETAKDLASEARAASGDVKWVAIDHQYFLFAAAPLDKETGLLCARSSAPGKGLLEARLRYDVPTTLEPNQSIKESLVVYAGPKLIDQLEGVSKAIGQETKLGDAVDLGWLAILARPMLLLLKLFHGWFGSWGLAIILLTLIVKGATLYWTTKSMRSMKAMSQLKPEMDKIREKFPDDKTRQNEEMLKLYRTHKISPLGGCLPMFLQMPVWLALYRTLSASAELFRAPFAGYLKDLTAPDPYYVLPVLMVLLMIVQTRISPTAADSQQQKIMQWTMPAVLGVMSLIFAAGLAVYMLTNSILGILHQYYMNRTDPTAKRPGSGPTPKVEVVREPAPQPASKKTRKHGQKG